MSKPKPLAVVRVKWLDATSLFELWEDDMNKLSLGETITFGVMIKETDDSVSIAQSVFKKVSKNDKELYRHIQTIPKANIIESVELKECASP